MAITIIGEDDKFYKEVSCSDCAARLRYTNADVQKHSYKEIDGSRSVDEYVPCPRCGKRVIVRSF